MRFEDKSIASPDLPEPAEQAAVLLEIFEGDICEAKAVADTNVRFATTEQDILSVLVPGWADIGFGRRSTDDSGVPKQTLDPAAEHLHPRKGALASPPTLMRLL
jgi:hypothetical protein